MDPLKLFPVFKHESVPEPKPVPEQEHEPPSPWESMQARPCDPSEPLDQIEAKLIKVFKKKHTTNAPEVLQEMEMISTGSICKKCLLFKRVCQAIGRQITNRETECQAKKFNLIQ